MLRYLLVFAAVIAVIASLRGSSRRRGRWGENWAMKDPLHPPNWMVAPSGRGPAVSKLMPAPGPAYDAIPENPYFMGPYFDAAPPLTPTPSPGAKPASNAADDWWPHAQYPAAYSWAANAPMRPLTLFDAYGAEYAKAAAAAKK